ncbi:hypothetical protein M0R45_029042 [Rubus argutus]|uniref:Uncharacterized protein n=1 Tax=Rubus argutus TaxID=59490 RepID=A0AAW1W7V3_RUBAR
MEGVGARTGLTSTQYGPATVLNGPAAEQVEDEANSIETEPAEKEATTKDEGLDEKPDMNDVPMEENQDNNQIICQDLNESTPMGM